MPGHNPGARVSAARVAAAAAHGTGRPIGSARPRRSLAGSVALVLAATVLAACGGGAAGPPSLTWYINPDDGGQEEIASRCTAAAGGRYTIEAALLPNDAPAQREQLVRRLAANDSSIDLMSLDPPYIPEFAEAGFLAPIPPDVAQRVTEGVVPSAVAGASWEDQLVTVPFWANTQLLWYRKSVAEAAGLDLSQPVTWDQVVAAAEQQGKLVGVHGARSESLTVWINALIESGGGSIIQVRAPEPGDIELGLISDPAVRAAEVIDQIAGSPVAGPSLSTQDENAAAESFEGDDGGFMVNWPFVWASAESAVEEGTLDPAVPADYGWALYPQVAPGEPSRPPYGGINLGVGAFSQNPDLAFEAAECIQSEDNQAYYFVTNGNPASKAAVFDRPEVLEAYPMAPVIRDSLEQAAPRPQTPYYNEVSGGLQRTYHPPASVVPGVTGSQAAELITAVLAKEQLL